MSWRKDFIIFCLCLVICCLVLFIVQKKFKNRNNISKTDAQKLLVIVVGGMRHDYIDREDTLKAFPILTRHGVHVKANDPVFPATSSPNMYTIATGRFPENHGILNTNMHDPLHDDVFMNGATSNSSRPYWWDQAEPIWNLAEKSNIKTSVYFWKGCNVRINGLAPSRCVPYKPLKDFSDVNEEYLDHLYGILDDFEGGQFTFTLLYYEQLDYYGRVYGPDANETRRAVRELDNMLYQFLRELTKRNLQDNINIYVMSDHGMSAPLGYVNLKSIFDTTNNIKIAIGSHTACCVSVLHQATEDKIYEKILTTSNGSLVVYKKPEIPVELHIGHNRRVLNLLIRARKGQVMYFPQNLKNVILPASANQVRGVDGYYSEEESDMWGTVFAVGPAFKQNLTVERVHQTDHYGLFCKLLGLKSKWHVDSARLMNWLA